MVRARANAPRGRGAAHHRAARGSRSYLAKVGGARARRKWRCAGHADPRRVGGKRGPLPYARARELLVAFAQTRAKEATPVLLKSLDDVRLRPYVAETLAAMGQTGGARPFGRTLGERALSKHAGSRSPRRSFNWAPSQSWSTRWFVFWVPPIHCPTGSNWRFARGSSRAWGGPSQSNCGG